MVCPHCGNPRPASHHFRDAGNLTVDAVEQLGYCPELAARRTRPDRLHVADLAIAAREDAALAAQDPRLTADEYAAALARALSTDPT